MKLPMAAAALMSMLFTEQGSAQIRNQPEALQRGRQVFTYWCATCHGAGSGKGGTVALAFKYKGTKPALLEERTDLTADEVRYFVRNGVSIMPFFRRTEIDEQDLSDVSAYLARNSQQK